ncbi:MAG: hypothetical protein GY719_31150 [bacterium]|nr:hypothetical protein [bacterium]
MATRPALVAAVFLGLCAMSASSSDCPPKTPVEGDQKKVYGLREGGYCDGQLAALHGGSLQALTVEIPRGESTGKAPFAVHVVTGPEVGPGAIISLQGLPRDPGLNYRLDAQRRLDQIPLMMEADAALWELDLSPAEIGWLAWTQQSGEEKTFWPVTSDEAGGSIVEISVRSALQAAVLRAWVTDSTGQVVAQDFAVNIDPGYPITFSLPTGPTGVVVVNLVVEDPDGVSSESTSLRLWRP